MKNNFPVNELRNIDDTVGKTKSCPLTVPVNFFIRLVSRGPSKSNLVNSDNILKKKTIIPLIPFL